ncbi:hypothetical protein NCS52_00976800 [Fusarium sp. LHS14.1]|nr:hypothetical protein NCS52_00976800 [Fusarium sp. LHS14.1]
MTPKKKGRRGRKRAILATAADFRVVDHKSHGKSPAKKGEKEKDEFGDEIEFTMDLKVQWTYSPSWEGELPEGWFREKDLQGLNQSLVLQCWEDKGGRDACCDFDTKKAHFLAIHDERMDAKSHRKSYQVQFVGYSNDPTF